MYNNNCNQRNENEQEDGGRFAALNSFELKRIRAKEADGNASTFCNLSIYLSIKPPLDFAEAGQLPLNCMLVE